MKAHVQFNVICLNFNRVRAHVQFNVICLNFNRVRAHVQLNVTFPVHREEKEAEGYCI